MDKILLSFDEHELVIPHISALKKEEVKSFYTVLNDGRIPLPEEFVSYKIHITCSGLEYTETYLDPNHFARTAKRIEDELMDFYKAV
jgi:hypothetical protein